MNKLSDVKFKAPIGNKETAASNSGFKYNEIIGDGNCLYRSIALAQYGNENDHLRVRMEILKYLNDHMRDIGLPHDIRQYIREQQIPNAWGEYYSIVAAANLYGRPILIYIPNFTDKRFDIVEGFCTRSDIKGTPFINPDPIKLSYENYAHYALLTPKPPRGAYAAAVDEGKNTGGGGGGGGPK